MNLYRIDTTDHQGRDCGPVSDLLGVLLTPSWSIARSKAIDAATVDPPRFAHITRINNSGRMSECGIVAPGSKVVGRIS